MPSDRPDEFLTCLCVASRPGDGRVRDVETAVLSMMSTALGNASAEIGWTHGRKLQARRCVFEVVKVLV